ncbi:MAG: pyridoxal phosphate-dependent aminotransferase [Abditibacteriota bacterium]|nr:pyridoxal phosphate-dependent aminotransferase [Abditibacteriota bacterium]
MSLFISQRALGISPSPTLAISAKAKQMKAEGIDVISFGAGEPDFDTPDFIKQACIKSLEDGFTKYTPVGGTAGLKGAIVDKLRRDNGLEYTPDNILVSVGAKHSIYNAIMATVDPGDEVIIPAPYWVSYPEIVKMAGGRSVFVSAGEEAGFCLTAGQIRDAITPRTKMLILNSPSNPSGAVYDRKTLEEIARVCEEAEILVLADEIYEKIIYGDARHVSIASLGDKIKSLTITVNGHSKAYSMTGWRLGYAAADAEIIKAMSKIQGHSTSNPTSFVQAAGQAALAADQGFLADMVRAFEERRDVICSLLNSIDGISCLVPDGAFYVLPNVSGLFGRSCRKGCIKSADDLCSYLLEDALCACVSGSGFGVPDNIRLSYATGMDNIKEGVGRIAEAVGKLN